jgi:hypothetical protein
MGRRVRDRRGGDASQLTEIKEDMTDFRWSPDSKQLLLTLKAKDEGGCEARAPEADCDRYDKYLGMPPAAKTATEKKAE